MRGVKTGTAKIDRSWAIRLVYGESASRTKPVEEWIKTGERSAERVRPLATEVALFLAEYRKEVEEELRASIESELRASIESELRASIESELRAPIESELQKGAP